MVKQPIDGSQIDLSKAFLNATTYVDVSYAFIADTTLDSPSCDMCSEGTSFVSSMMGH